MTSFAGDYRPGQPYGICDRCDTKTRLYALKREWTNLLVCERCWDPEPVHLHTPYLDPGEGAPIPDARPELIVEVEDEDLAFEYRDGTTYEPPE